MAFHLITNRQRQLPGDYKPAAGHGGRSAHRPGRMNKKELRYSLGLEADKRAGKIKDWQFEAVTLKLADKPPGSKMRGTTYRPDFLVWMPDGSIEFRECKGHAEDDWVVKWKVAIERYPMFKFVLVE
jgi:hypothetical protein